VYDEKLSSVISVLNIYVIGTFAGFGALLFFSSQSFLSTMESTMIALFLTVAMAASITLYADRQHSYRFEDEEDDDSDSDSPSSLD